MNMKAQIKPKVYKLDKLADVIPLDAPYGISISIGNACDFKCVYCVSAMNDTKAGHLKHMSLEEFKLIAEQIAQFEKPIRQVSFISQGETILNQSLPDMVKMLKDRGLANRVKVLTNANRLTPELSDKLIAAGLDVLRISLQGITAENYLKICRTKIDFEAFVNQIRYFYEHRGSCNLHVKIIDIALDEGQEALFYDIFGNISDYIFIEKCTGAYQEYLGKDNNGLNRFLHNLSNIRICPQPFYFMKIDHNGNVLPCCQVNANIDDGKFVITNCITSGKNLKQIWDVNFRPLQYELLQGDISEEHMCFACERFAEIEKEENILDNDRNEILARYADYMPRSIQFFKR